MLDRLAGLLVVCAALVAAAFLLALSGGSSGSPAFAAGGSVAAMSSGTPYVAPWETGFKRYATQIYLPTFPGPTSARMTIPDGQWWRIVYLQGELGTGATVANRTVRMTVEKPLGTFLFQLTMPGSQVANGFGIYLLGPGLTGYANTTDPTASGYVAPLPDLLWQPGVIITLFVANAQANDAWQGRVNFAVEVYTPEKEGSPILVPTPQIP